MAAIFHPPGSIAFFEDNDKDEDARRPDQPDEALRFRRLQLEDEYKRIPADGLLRAKEQMDAMRADQAQKALELGKTEGLEVARLIPSDWQWIGPGNVGGRIRSIAIHPTTPTRMWVGSVAGGIWYSSNAGATWAPVNDFLANLAVSTIVIDPSNPSIMYAGTGEGFGNADALQGNGIFKSTDSGVTWNLLASTNTAIDPPPPGCGMGSTPCPNFWFFINRLAISPNGGTLLAASSAGLARSTDGGATWLQQGVQSTVDLDFRPADSTQAVLGQIGRAFYTTNSGQNWTQATFNPGITGRVELAYAGNGTPQIVYAAVDNNNGDIYRSNDGGQNFTRVNTGLNYFLAGGNSQGWYANAIWVNPQDATSVIVGGTDLWRSTDSGTTFTQISEWACAPLTGNACQGTSAHADHHVIVSAPGFNNTTNKSVYFGNDGGIYRTDDVSAVAKRSGWITLNNNLGVTQLYSGATTPTGRIVGGAQDNGNVINAPLPSPSPNAYNPQTWVTPTGAYGDGGFVAADPTDANYLYTEYVYLEIRRSSNGGNSVTAINTGITDSTQACGNPAGNCANFVAPFILDPNNSSRMLAGGTSLWRSNDVKAAAPTWTAIKAPYSFNIPPSNQPISAIAVSQGNSDFIVVGHNDGSIFLTSDGTAAAPTWTKIDMAALPNRFLTRLVIDATRSPNWIYATFGGFSPDNVYVTKDLGVTWMDITGSGTTALPDIPVRSLTINPVRPDFLYVGTELGIFASEDAGATWQLPQGGPANVSVDELFWSNGVLTAATHGRGFYMTKTPSFSQPASCNPPPTCPNNTCTPGWWDCVCTWNNNQIPGPNDDVSVTCPILVRGNSVSPRNLRVDGHLTFAPSASLQMATGDVSNFGTIDGGIELRMKNLINSGTISTGRVWALGDLVTSGTGQIEGNGTIQTSAGWSSSETQYPIQANNITLGEHGSLIANGVLCNGNLAIGPGASLHALGGNPQNGKVALFLNGNATNLGFLDVRGEFGTSIGQQGGTALHTFAGSGQWKVGALTIGDRYDPRFGGYSTVTLDSDLTIEVTGLPAFANNSMVISAQATIKQNGHNFYLNASSLWNYGQIDVSTGSLNLSGASIKIGEASGSSRNSSLGPAGFIGTGAVNLNRNGDMFLEALLQTWQPSLNLLAGVVDFRSGVTISRNFTIAAGATMNLNTGQLALPSDATINGTLGKSSGFSGGVVSFTGGTFTNNGSVSVDQFWFNYGANTVPRNITLAGPGAWPAARLVRVGYSSVPTNLILANDMALNWAQLSIYGGSTIQTGASTLTLPCSMTFDPSSTQFINGEIIGTVRHTNLGDCAGAAIPFTSRFTTVRFDSGTPPTELTINVLREPPAGFGNAVRRTYNITPLGGSAWSSTLRLSYADADLNGNSEASLALYRNTGASWNPAGVSARSSSENWAELTGVTDFSRWTLSSVGPATGDSDGDGMSDEFEQAYFGSPTAGDPALDSDGDGKTNLEEFRAGTVPTNPASAFKVTSTSRIAGGAVTFSFASVSGKNYRVDYRISFASGDWIPLQTNIAGTGADVTVTDNSAAGEPGRFYRVVVLP